MIEVYLRNADSAVGLILGEFSPVDVKHLVDIARQSPCYYGEDTGEFLQAQFVSDSQESTKIYFEIVFGKD